MSVERRRCQSQLGGRALIDDTDRVRRLGAEPFDQARGPVGETGGHRQADEGAARQRPTPPHRLDPHGAAAPPAGRWEEGNQAQGDNAKDEGHTSAAGTHGRPHAGEGRSVPF
jgi:hypothetical protein